MICAIIAEGTPHDYGAPFKNWLLPGAIEHIRRKLAAVDDGGRQMVDILGAVLTDGLGAVEAAYPSAEWSLRVL